jgi:hypothetical protein
MASTRTLKATVKRAQKEVKKLLAQARADKLNKAKLETGLEEVENELKILDIHAHSFDAK